MKTVITLSVKCKQNIHDAVQNITPTVIMDSEIQKYSWTCIMMTGCFLVEKLGQENNPVLHNLWIQHRKALHVIILKLNIFHNDMKQYILRKPAFVSRNDTILNFDIFKNWTLLKPCAFIEKLKKTKSDIFLTDPEKKYIPFDAARGKEVLISWNCLENKTRFRRLVYCGKNWRK